jgi:Tol biopolymer transport system component
MARTRSLLLALIVGAGPAAAQQVASIQLSHASVSLAAGGRQIVFATAYTSGGSPVSVRFRWTSGDAAVVAVEVSESESDFAELVAVGAGTTRVTVQAGGRSESVEVTVTGGVGAGTGAAAVLNIDPPTVQLLRGESQRLRAVFLRADGEPASPAPVQWSSLSPAVVGVNPSTGLAVGLSAGEGAVQATAGTLNRIATVTVADVPFAFTVPVLALSPDAEATIGVVVPSQRGRALSSDGLTWRSSDEQIVRVTPLGVARAVAPGRAAVLVEGYGQVRELPVTVHRVVAFVDAAPPTSQVPVRVPLHGRQRFRVVSRAADESEIPEAPVVWSVQDTAIAGFDPATGELTGRALGTTTLRAGTAAAGVEDFVWQIEVIAGGIRLAPDRVGFGVGDAATLAASFTTEAGEPMGPAEGVRWLTENANVVRVDGDGRISGVAPGRARVVASTPWGRADTAEVFVLGSLLFTSSRTGSADLFVADPATPAQEPRQITTTASQEGMAAWSPDGSRIVFVSDRDGNYDLYLSDADGADARRLTATPDVDELTPDWAPDGTEIVYAAHGPGGLTQVWAVKSDGSGARPLTSEAQGSNMDPVVSPDGRLIAFTSTRAGGYDIHLMARDGTQQRPVLVSPAKESKPAWFPNGDLAFVQERTERGRPLPGVVRRNDVSGNVESLWLTNMPVSDFAISGRGDVLAVEVATPGAGNRFEHRLFILPVGGEAVELARQPGEQQLQPALRPSAGR